jgi:hypothetical protein
MSNENSPESAASRLTQAELQVGEQAGDQIGRQIAPEKLQSVSLAASVRAEMAAESTTQPFKPVAANIDKFLDNESIGSGLKKDDLSKIIKSAIGSGDTERSQVAKFLNDHFDDICSLSANGGDRISRNDLTLYSQMLKQSEKNVAAGRFAWSGQQDVHDQHENKAGTLLPVAGMVGGVYGGHKLLNAIQYNPAVVMKSLDIALTNPRNYLIATTAARVTGLVVGAYLGSKAGGMIDRGMQDSGVRRHFVDEAEPAMKRLLQT